MDKKKKTSSINQLMKQELKYDKLMFSTSPIQKAQKPQERTDNVGIFEKLHKDINPTFSRKALFLKDKQVKDEGLPKIISPNSKQGLSSQQFRQFMKEYMLSTTNLNSTGDLQSPKESMIQITEKDENADSKLGIRNTSQTSNPKKTPGKTSPKIKKKVHTKSISRNFKITTSLYFGNISKISPERDERPQSTSTSRKFMNTSSTVSSPQNMQVKFYSPRNLEKTYDTLNFNNTNNTRVSTQSTQSNQNTLQTERVPDQPKDSYYQEKNYFDYFKREYIPSQIVEEHSKQVYQFFNIIRLFWSLISNFSDTQNAWNSIKMFAAIKENSVVDNSAFYSNANKSLVESFQHSHQIDLKISTVIAILRTEVENRSELKSNRSQEVDLDALLNESRSYYENFTKDCSQFIPNPTEHFGGYTNKYEIETFEGKSFNFFELLLMDFETNLAENLNVAKPFHALLKNYRNRDDGMDYIDLKQSLQNIWNHLDEAMSINSDNFKYQYSAMINGIKFLKSQFEMQKEIVRLLTKPNVETIPIEKISTIVSEIQKFKLFIDTRIGVNIIQKLKSRSSNLLKSLGHIKIIEDLESKYYHDLEYAKKIILLIQEKLVEFDQRHQRNQMTQKDLITAHEFLNEIDQVISKVNLCKYHLNQGNKYDLHFQSDFLKKGLEDIGSLTDDLTKYNDDFKNLIESSTAQTKKSYETLTSEIRKNDNSFNTYIINNIIKSSSLIFMKNPGQHMISISNFSKIMQKHAETLNSFSRRFDVERGSKEDGYENIQYPPHTIFFHPSFSQLAFIISEFEKKVLLFDELFSFEDIFSLKSLEANFKLNSSLTIPAQIHKLITILSEIIEKECEIGQELNTKENEFIQKFIQEMLQFQNKILKALKVIYKATSLNVEELDQISMKVLDHPKITAESTKSIFRKGTSIIEDKLENIAMEHLNSLSDSHPIYNFFYKLMLNLRTREAEFLHSLAENLAESFSNMKDFDNLVDKHFCTMTKLFEALENVNVTMPIFEDSQNKLLNNKEKICLLIETKKHHISEKMQLILDNLISNLNNKISDIDIIKIILEFQDSFTLSSFKQTLEFQSGSFESNWKDLEDYTFKLTNRLDTQMRQARGYINKKGTVHDRKNEFKNFIEYLLEFLAHIIQFRRITKEESEKQFRIYTYEAPSFARYLRELSAIYTNFLHNSMEFILKLDNKQTPVSCRNIFDKFVNRIIKVELNVLNEITQNSIEIENLIQVLDNRFFEHDQYILTEFLIPNYNDDSRLELEEFCFTTNNHVNKIKDYVEAREICEKANLAEELNRKVQKLQRLANFLTITCSINQDAHLMKEKVSVFVSDTKFTKAKLKDNVEDVDNLISLIRKGIVSVRFNIEALDDKRVTEYMETQFFSVFRVIDDALAHLSLFIKSLYKFYDDMRIKFAGVAYFSKSDYLKSLNKGIVVHNGLRYEELAMRVPENEGDQQVSAKASHSSTLLLYRRYIDAVGIQKKYQALVKSVYDEYCKAKKEILQNVTKAILIMQDHVINESIERNIYGKSSDSSPNILNHIYSIFGEAEGGKIDFSEFCKKLREINVTKKNVEWALLVLKDTESLKRIEINAVENFQAIAKCYENNQNLKDWLIFLDLFEQNIAERLSNHGKFESTTEYNEFLLSMISVNITNVEKFYNQNHDTLVIIYRAYFD